MNDDQELAIAKHILWQAHRMAEKSCKEHDVEAATVAILMRAFELATQDLSVERRNQLLKGEFE